MLQPGTQVGRYEIQRRLGRGGMGTVYVAHDPVLGRMVAVKVFSTDLDLPDAAQRFAREARSAAKLNHPNIVTVHDYGDFASQPFIVMEYVQGETLAEVIRRNAPVALTDKLRWIEELCAGAAYAHRGGVIHRDIKPTNLMINRSGQLKILDFGIARLLGTLAPRATALVGTPGYMAPEQILGEPFDHRADLFSVGVVCYELLTYTDAFPGDTIPTITHRILSQEPVALPQLIPDLHPDLVAIIERSLRKRADQRFDDAESMQAAVGRLRRKLEHDPGGDARTPTVLVQRPAPGVSSRRGTGSERHQAPGVAGVAQLTPPPDPRRTDREELARRRAMQIEACLDRARTLLDGGDTDAALEACVQALTLEETHPGALELEQAIHAAASRHRAGVLLGEARDELAKGALTVAQGLLQQARALDPEGVDVQRLALDLRLAREGQERQRQRGQSLNDAVVSGSEADAGALQQFDDVADPDTMSVTIDPSVAATMVPTVLSSLAGGRQARIDIGSGEIAPTVIAPVARRTPPPVVSPAATGNAPVVAPVAVAEPARPSKWDAGDAIRRLRHDVVPRIRAFVEPAITSVLAILHARTKKERLLIGAGAATLVVLGIASVMVLGPAAPTATGALTIEALPWATITSIETEAGSRQPLPSPASTPLSLTLPAGTYRVQLQGPSGNADLRVVTIEVPANGAAVVPVQRFRALTPEEYFEPYLTSAAATTLDATGEPEPAQTNAGAPPAASPATTPGAETSLPQVAPAGAQGVAR